MSCENTINKLVFEVCKLKRKNDNNCCDKLEDEINKVLQFTESNNLRMTNYMNWLNNDDNIISCETTITFPNINVNNPNFNNIDFIKNTFNDILGALGLRNLYFISYLPILDNPYSYEVTFELQSYQLDFCNQIIQSINNNITPIFWSQMTVSSSGNQLEELLIYNITPLIEIPPGPSSIPKNIAILSPLNKSFNKSLDKSLNKSLNNEKNQINENKIVHNIEEDNIENRLKILLENTESSSISEQTEEILSKNNIQTNNTFTEISLEQSTEDIDERLRKLLENTESSELSYDTEDILNKFN
jgi:hypothetical protein